MRAFSLVRFLSGKNLADQRKHRGFVRGLTGGLSLHSRFTLKRRLKGQGGLWMRPQIFERVTIDSNGKHNNLRAQSLQCLRFAPHYQVFCLDCGT